MTQQNPTEKLPARLSFFTSNKLGLAILAVLIVIAGGVSYIVFNQIQAQNKEKTARTLLDMKGLLRSRLMIFLSTTYVGPKCDQSKAELVQANHQLEQFLKDHPDAENELQAYLIKTGLINNQDYLISYGMGGQDPELARLLFAKKRELSTPLSYIIGSMPSNAQIQAAQAKYCH